MKRTLILIIVMAAAGPARAKVDLVTLPTRETVQLTIYNSADLTLARESRALTVSEGTNRLQFSWADTLIDPTSLEMHPKAQADKVDVLDIVYPPRTKNLGLWNIESRTSGKVPVEISYLTSGLSWRAFYMGTLTPDEKTMRLQGYVRVTNNSGEDYENAQTRLLVGKVNLLDQIAMLAKRDAPYGKPDQRRLQEGRQVMLGMSFKSDDREEGLPRSQSLHRKKIVKEGLSEYFLYTIEGTETISHGWSKRLPSFDVAAVPVVNLYKHDDQRYGHRVVRFLSFRNDDAHKLGETPIPGGVLKVYRNVDEAGHLSYTGQSSFKYIPVGEVVELNLGAVSDVVVEPKLMDRRTANIRFDGNGDISGHDEVLTFGFKVKNTRDVPAKIEITRHAGSDTWMLERADEVGTYEKVDKQTFRFTLRLDPKSEAKFGYVLTIHHGIRREEANR